MKWKGLNNTVRLQVQEDPQTIGTQSPSESADHSAAILNSLTPFLPKNLFSSF